MALQREGKLETNSTLSRLACVAQKAQKHTQNPIFKERPVSSQLLKAVDNNKK